MSISKTCPLKKSAKVLARRSISACGAGEPVTAGVCAGSTAACVVGGDGCCADSAAGIGGTVGAATGAGGLIDASVLASGDAGVAAGRLGCVGPGAGAAVG